MSPSHQIRVRQNNCEHEWHRGVTISDMIKYKCFKCNKEYWPGISKFEVPFLDQQPESKQE